MPQQEQWQVSGNAAELYERYAVPFVLGPWAPGLIAQAALQPGERVLDVACGTGVVARLAAQHVGANGQVVGLDLNPGMLAIARTVPPLPGASVTWQEGNAMALPFAEGIFEVVCCQQGLQFFPDRLAALREMHRVLVPGGRVVLSVWRAIESDPYAVALAAALERYVSAEAVASLRAAYALADAEALQRLMTAAGLRNVDIRAVRLTRRIPLPEAFTLWQLAATPMAGAVAAVDDKARAALVQEVSDALRAYRDGDGLALPAEIHLAVAHTEA